VLPDGLVKDRRLGTARTIDGSRLRAPLTGRREDISRHGMRNCEGCARSRKKPRAGASCREGTLHPSGGNKRERRVERAPGDRREVGVNCSRGRMPERRVSAGGRNGRFREEAIAPLI